VSVNGITSRRRPWPYDAYIGPVKTRLAPVEGQLVTEKTKTLDATAPIDYTYGSANPFKERTSEWQDLFGGFGQSEAPTTIPRRYDHAEYVDASIDGLWMLGPRFEDHIETIDDSPAPGEVRQLVKALHGGVLTVFAICENGVWRRSGDGSWVESLTTATSPALPGGTHPQQALRFKHRGVTPLDALYLATDNTNLYRYDGAAWTVAGAAAGPGTGAVQGEARWLERVGDEFWVAGDYWIVKCEDDPMNRPNYSGVIYIGDQTAKVTQIKQVDNTLYAWKEDGIYTVDQDGVDVDLFPTLRYRNNLANGKNASVWIDRIWFTYGDQTLMLDSQATLKPDGFEQMLENTSVVRGQWIGGAGHNTWFFYEVYYNTAINTSFLVKHGTWVEETSSASKPGVSQYAEAHHGAIYQWNKRATSATVVSGLHTGGNDRLYIGFSNGTVEWTPLPRHSPNPAEDTNCEFTSKPAYMYLPLHHSGFRADNKLYHGVTAFGPRLTAAEWVEVEYKLDVTNSLAPWLTFSTGVDARFTYPGQRQQFSSTESTNPVYGTAIMLRIALKKNPDTTISPRYLTPMLHGIGIHESLRPAFSREFTFIVGAKSYMALRDGKVDRRRGSDIYSALLQQAQEVGTVIMLLPTGTYEEMTIIDWHDTSVPENLRRDFEWAIQVHAIQLRTRSSVSGSTVGGDLGGGSTAPPPVTGGFTYDTLEQYTLDQLESII
jgi:hypothetical protein